MGYSGKYEDVVSIFWDGDYKGRKYSFDEDGYKIAILRAFFDLTQRTMSRKDKSKSVTREMLRDYACNDSNFKYGKSFLTMLKELFNSSEINQDAFDTWHKNSCDIVLQCLEQFYVKDDVTYGKAQKIVNMTLKNAYCLKGADKKNEYFTYCHIALDSYTLEWIKREILPWHNEKIKGKKISMSSYSVWSNLDIEQYCELTSLVRGFFEGKSDDKYKDVTPFQCEFYKWPELQWHLSAEAFIFQSINGGNALGKKERSEIKNLSIKEKAERIEGILKKLKENKLC